MQFKNEENLRKREEEDRSKEEKKIEFVERQAKRSSKARESESNLNTDACNRGECDENHQQCDSL